MRKHPSFVLHPPCSRRGPLPRARDFVAGVKLVIRPRVPASSSSAGYIRHALLLLAALTTGGCAQPIVSPARPDFTPRYDNMEPPLRLDASIVPPMYTELLPIDLKTVIEVTSAQNIDIRLARYQVEQSKGRLESAVGSAFPMLVPSAIFQRVDGRNLNANGDLFSVGFNSFQPSVAVQWIANPGQVVYEIVAAKKRLAAVQHDEAAVVQRMLRLSALQYYELALAQARISAATQALEEAFELARINKLQVDIGTGVLADDLRAQARVAEREQDLALALNALYRASLALVSTLQIDDPTITLVPSADELTPMPLVREDAEIDELLACAVTIRPDLLSVRELIDAATAERGATWWGGFGPEFALSYQYGGITGHSNNIRRSDGIPSNLILNPLSEDGSFSDNPFRNGLTRELIQRASRRAQPSRDVTFKFNQRTEARAGVAARWSLSAFGNLKAASAARDQAIAEAERAFLDAKVEVVDAAQTSQTNRRLIELSRQQVRAAEEALRLTQANLEAGTMTTLDVLQSQDAVAQARLRFAEAVIRYNQSQVNLLAALGILDERNTFK
jgi:outer membrane protein TolC